MARDIEDFLRKAAEKRRQKQQQQNQPAQPVRSTPRPAARKPVEIVEEIEVVEPRKKLVPRPAPIQSDLRSETVVQHVTRHIDTHDISDHAEHLGDRIHNANERISAKIQNKFDHDVSKLDELPSVQDDTVASVTRPAVSKTANELLSMLSSPQSIRQAILISEILNRPNFD